MVTAALAAAALNSAETTPFSRSRFRFPRMSSMEKGVGLRGGRPYTWGCQRPDANCRKDEAAATAAAAAAAAAVVPVGDTTDDAGGVDVGDGVVATEEAEDILVIAAAVAFETEVGGARLHAISVIGASSWCTSN